MKRMPMLYDETEEMRENIRYHGPCARCGYPIIIPKDEAWAFEDSHPWEGMCLARLQVHARKSG